ncbi:RelA/SpoT family protein [Acanthopleuribacter pedis]|uniref:Bifunctional (P)ppGpp synthetase/guanosine-3',5'-bis(Diphosphate) 3'-pyrophosphohydrolase n=1 Tax=Acanthopleuribacter pedis TaxID=442870 RepID=A0A8J7Q4Q5_9BACT|nr:bifunctional (p)ppGpp synthetase/guanosine-3',5'-bis(diphosphate) 3'-pyrophosphohydrolase [Acanthopleuribacter pedis]MBO1319035.1 bifunctional (p)ppGpp synthetase/guanosine-3',5'-bis(diphosphate) 3'-pyrophosphohydrolase [Acanthopleuribacter pedis]
MTLKEQLSAIKEWAGLSKTKNRTVDDVVRVFLENHPDADADYLRRAHAFAHQAHEGQTRKSGEPYIIHPVAVAYILAERKLDLETVAAGFLHDVVEDCEVEVSQLEKHFGKGLARIVDGVTKIGKVKFQNKDQAQAENYRKMILAMSEDIRVLVVKLADRCHNMSTLGHLGEEKRRRISQETLDIYTPLAHRIGMSNLKLELERLSFLHMEPDAYAELDKQLTDRERSNKGVLESIAHEMEGLMEEFDVQGDVSSRIKSHYSIYRKMRRKKCTLDGLYDYYAFRILTHSVGDCYKMFGLLHSKWRHIPGRIKDFIATPKSNLYQSIHTTLLSERGQPFEVQVRTHTMHRIAEEGVAAHWTYKNGRLLSVGKNEFVSWLRRVADEQKEVQDSDEFLETIKGQLQTDEILVFTPNSEIKTLPKGATPLDFAYHIHTEVGHQAVAAKVDGKMVPLRSELQSGSIVEIITSAGQTPSEEWLQYVRSSSARSKIRAWLRARAREKAVEMGRNLFERELKRCKVPLKKISNNVIQGRLKTLGYKKIDDFYSAIGFGNITPNKAVKPFLPEDQTETGPSADQVRESRLQRAFQRISRKSRNMVLVKGTPEVLVNLSKCCNPILGDPIVGHITQGRGVMVHKKGCKTLQSQNVPPERKIPVEWAGPSDNQVFEVAIRVYTEDRPGMIADVTAAISDAKTNVSNMKANTDTEKSMGVFEFVLQVNALTHFDKVIGNLKKVRGFLGYDRIR